MRGQAQNLRKILAQQTPERRIGLSQLPVTGLPSPSIAVPGRQRGSSLLQNQLGQAAVNIAGTQAQNRFALQNRQFMLQQALQQQQVANRQRQLQHQTDIGRDRFENQTARSIAGRELYGYSLPQRDDAISGALTSIIGAGRRAGQIYHKGRKKEEAGSGLTNKERKALKTLGLI